MKQDRILNLKYAVTQILYYASLCAAVGYATVYLLSRGFTNGQIGLVLAASNILAAFLQPAVAIYADDHKQVPLQIIAGLQTAVMAATALIVWLVPMNRLWLGILFVIPCTLCISLMPLMNALSFVFAADGVRINYGMARGLGSGAYAAASIVIGSAAAASPDSIPLFLVVFAVLATWSLHCYRLPADSGRTAAAAPSQKKQLTLRQFAVKYRYFVFFLIGFSMIYLDHIFINDFFIQILRPIGGTSVDMGYAVSFAAILEVPVMFLFTRISRRFSCRTLIKFSLIMFVAKYLLTFLAGNLTVIYIAQFLQLFSYALFMPASVMYVNEIISPEDCVKGQSMVTVAMCIGSVFASALGGVLIDQLGVRLSLLVTLLLAAAGLVIVFLTIDHAEQKDHLRS